MTSVIHSLFKYCKQCGSETERTPRGRCKKCTRDYHTAWRAANPEKVKAHNATYYISNKEKIQRRVKDWRSENPEKARLSSQQAALAWKIANIDKVRIYWINRRAALIKAGGSLSHGLSAKLYKLQKGKCACCGLPLGDNYHLDHIMPLALGGTNTDDNMQLLRATCNQEKWKKHPVDFMQQRGFLL